MNLPPLPKPAKKPNQPTHRLRLLDKESGRGATVGAGWLNKDGHITINLNPGVRLSWDDNVTLTLWPVDPNTEGNQS